MAMPHRFPPKANGMGDRLYADEALNDASLARGPAWKPSPPTVGGEEAERMGALGNGSAYVPYGEGEKPLQDDPIGNALVGSVGPAVGKVAVKVGTKGLGKLADVLKSMMKADADDISGGILNGGSRAPIVKPEFDPLPMGPGSKLSPGEEVPLKTNAMKDEDWWKAKEAAFADAKRFEGLPQEELGPLPVLRGDKYMPFEPGHLTQTPGRLQKDALALKASVDSRTPSQVERIREMIERGEFDNPEGAQVRMAQFDKTNPLRVNSLPKDIAHDVSIPPEWGGLPRLPSSVPVSTFPPPLREQTLPGWKRHR